MAGGGDVSDAQFKGWQKHFNTYTLRGRANVSFVFLSNRNEAMNSKCSVFKENVLNENMSIKTKFSIIA